jgi:hypothetical protein
MPGTLEAHQNGFRCAEMQELLLLLLLHGHFGNCLPLGMLLHALMCLCSLWHVLPQARTMEALRQHPAAAAAALWAPWQLLSLACCPACCYCMP